MAVEYTDQNLNIVITGDYAVGKLAILNRYTSGKFVDQQVFGKCQYSCRYVYKLHMYKYMLFTRDLFTDCSFHVLMTIMIGLLASPLKLHVTRSFILKYL